MCRHLGWIGNPRTIASLMLEPEHSLLRQSYRPRLQSHGRINADGWGVGFYADGLDTPRRWRSNRPVWSDASLASIAPALSSSCVVAAVRSATAGMPLDETATAPFMSGRWLVSHNGVVDRSVLGGHSGAESACDSALLAAHLFTFDPRRLGEFVTDVGARDPNARLNVLVADGEQLLATRWNDTLSVLQTSAGVVVASEPYDDDPRWAEVPEHHLVQVRGGDVLVTGLES